MLLTLLFFWFFRDIRDRSVLRVFEGDGVNGGGGSAWDSSGDQSYFSEPEFESDFHHSHKSKVSLLIYISFIKVLRNVIENKIIVEQQRIKYVDR